MRRGVRPAHGIGMRMGLACAVRLQRGLLMRLHAAAAHHPWYTESAVAQQTARAVVQHLSQPAPAVDPAPAPARGRKRAGAPPDAAGGGSGDGGGGGHADAGAPAAKKPRAKAKADPLRMPAPGTGNYAVLAVLYQVGWGGVGEGWRRRGDRGWGACEGRQVRRAAAGAAQCDEPAPAGDALPAHVLGRRHTSGARRRCRRRPSSRRSRRRAAPTLWRR